MQGKIIYILSFLDDEGEEECSVVATEGTYNRWTNKQTMILVRIFCEQIKILGVNSFKNRVLYDRVMECLSAKGLIVSREIMQKKWVNMVMTYRRIKHRQTIHKLNGTQEDFKNTWDYFEV